jgi:hypothetical protein
MFLVLVLKTKLAPVFKWRVVSNALDNSKASYSRTCPAIADRLFERSRRLQLTALEQLSEIRWSELGNEKATCSYVGSGRTIGRSV